MQYSEIEKLLKEMGESKVDLLELELPDGTKLKMKKNETQLVEENKTLIQEKAVLSKDKEKVEDEYKKVTSPMVGTFYSSPSPTEEPYVKVGDKVKKGDVLCVVEAMKLMNEIESEYDGEIVEICVNNEDMVEYGTTLFKIK